MEEIVYLQAFIFLIESFVESSSDSDLDEQKPSSEIGTANIMAPRTYYYHLAGSKHVLLEQQQEKDNFHRENGNEHINTIAENAYTTSTISNIQKTGSNISTLSNFKTNTTGGHAAKQLKKYANHRNAG